MLSNSEMFTELGSAVAGVMFVWAMFQQYFPQELRNYIQRHSLKFFGFVYPYVHIKVPEFSGQHLRRSPAYAAVENYLSANSSKSAKRLKADVVKDSDSLVLSMDDHEEVTDDFNGVKLRWRSGQTVSKSPSISLYPADEGKRYYTLTFHITHREAVTTSYLKHVMTQGKAIAARNRQRKLYTNSPSDSWSGYSRNKWSHVVFEHPASFDTLAMEAKKKEDIKKDLVKFREGKEYYAKIGKAWKRGYLLYGPPGTGKSTMIAAMANFLNYDIYDLELTTVKDNSELRKLLIETSSKSIIVIEDIDCSLDLTGQRKEEKKEEEEGEEEEKDPVKKKAEKEKEKKGKEKESKVTLSGLLNFIDGLWSACGGERLIVFTTNYVDKLDPALIRRGRMDMHIELSYCTFEAFKVLAYNYLNLETHPRFETIRRLLEETEMTPADVGENLMPKSWDAEVESCLECLIDALEKAKEEARKKKAEEEDKMKKAEEEEKAKEVNQSGGEEQKLDAIEANGTVSSDKKEVKENGAAARNNDTV